MKPLKNYLGVSETDAQRGFSDALAKPVPDDQALYDDVLTELMPSDEGGFIERQNVYDRI